MSHFRGCVIAIAGVIAAGTVGAQGPVIVDNGVLNGASFSQGSAPGALVSIFGDNLATSLASASSVPFSDTLNGVSVSIGGIAAPLRDVIPGTPTSRAQVNAQIPWDALQPGQTQATVAIAVTTNGVPSPSQQLLISEVAPGIFTIPPGVGNAIVINPDGSIAAPTDSIQGFPCHPAKRGDGVFFYATGLGAVDVAIGNGADSTDQLRHTKATFTVVIDGLPVAPFFTGLSPQYPGVNQVNFIVPNGARSGVVPLQIQTQDGTLYPPNSNTPPAVMAVE